MIYGYASKRTGGAIFTHITGFDSEILKEMEDHSHRFDGLTSRHPSIYGDNITPQAASFVHLNEKKHHNFIRKFNIHLVDTKKELQFLKKMLT